MLFNSPAFLFAFLPLAFGGFLLLKKLKYGQAALTFIGLASLVFYAYWDYRYLALLLASIAVNYVVGMRLVEKGPDKRVLIAGLAANILCLGWFKYAGFFIENLNFLFAADLPPPHIILPLGISFFTFVQIAWIVDAYKGRAERHGFTEYLAFVTFFPHLIAGPILDHKTIMPQFHTLPKRRYDWSMAATGLVMLAIGLFKKVVLADTLASYATPIFVAAGAEEALSVAQAWSGALAYTLQLYFDFSGYSDMAIGLGLMFGIRMPENFLSPYKSRSIIEFWRRWHITLSNFLKNYLYIPLGGSHHGVSWQYFNLMITMLLGGLWHGAGWTFVIWGGLHGAYLVINHAWKKTSPPHGNSKIHSIIGWFLTTLAVIIGWVFFRSETVGGAFIMLKAMAGMSVLGDIPNGVGFIALGFLIVLAAPNSLQIINYAKDEKTSWYSHRMNRRWAALTAVTLAVSLYLSVYSLNRVTEFIYFQF